MYNLMTSTYLTPLRAADGVDSGPPGEPTPPAPEALEGLPEDVTEAVGADGAEFTEAELAELRGEGDDEGPPAGVGADANAEADALVQHMEGTEGAPPAEGRTVSLAALHEARAENKEIKAELAKMKQFQEDLVQRARQAAVARQEQEAQAAKEADPPPDPNMDPVASAAWTQRQEIARQQREEQQQAAYRQQQEQAAAQHQAAQEADAVVTRADNALTAAAEADPNVTEAFNFASEAVTKRLEQQGYSGENLQRARQEIIYKYARDAPTDPAQMREYAFANARYWGWQQPQAPAPNARRSDPAALAASASEKIANLQAGQRSAATLSGGGSSDGSGDPTLDEILALPGEELEALISKHPDLVDRLTS